MKIIYSVAEAQAKLQKRSKAFVEIAAPVSYGYDALNMNRNPAVAAQNKITLIKMIRSLACDINRGLVAIDNGPLKNTISLFDAKLWVEKYSAQNFNQKY